MVVMDCGTGKNAASGKALKMEYVKDITLVACDICGDTLHSLIGDTNEVRPFKVDEVLF